MPVQRVGGYAWLLAALLFFAANVVAGLAWRQPRFSWTVNNISDLGNVTCGTWDTTRPREVCSPWHVAMNAAMIATGVLLVVGVLLTWMALGRGLATRIAQLLTLAGAGGYILAGVYPADVDEDQHFLAGLLIFVLGNVGLLVASLARPGTTLGDLSGFSCLLGVAGLGGTALFFVEVDLGFGVGGMERVAVFPLLIWAVAVGLRLLDVNRARSVAPSMSVRTEPG
jgi:hypothetical membrane protein